MICVDGILAVVDLPGSQGLNPQPRAFTHISPAFIGLAICALALIGYLVWDFCRQKIAERRERRRLVRFRERKLKKIPNVPVLKERPDRAQN
jgi:peptidoglycan/LPS O-acetylase OafA/YrhL